MGGQICHFLLVENEANWFALPSNFTEQPNAGNIKQPKVVATQ